MRKLFPLGLVVALFAGPANAELITYEFPISVDQAVPAPDIPTGAPTPFGSGVVDYDTDTNVLSWVIDYEALTGEIVAPGAHFHGPADFGDTAGIQVTMTDGDPPLAATGVLEGVAEITEDQETDLLNGLWYVNIHTARNQPGEIRGQVVPEPTSLALLALAGLGLLRRR